MRIRRYLSILGCAAVLVAAAPSAAAAPTDQYPAAGSYGTPEAGLLWAIQQVVPSEVLQRTAIQLQPLDWNTYLVSHPGLFWPANLAGNAQTVAQQLANHTPGWNTTMSNGPQGYGVYLTYDIAGSGMAQTGLLPAAQQVLPLEVLQQTPIQIQQLDGNSYLLSHPNLFWPVEQSATALGVAQQFATRMPGVHGTVLNGPHGYGIYLTYDTATYQTSQTGFLPSVQQVLAPEAFQQTPLQLHMQDGSSAYLVNHPSLFWSGNQAATAQAMVQQLAGVAPGWSSTMANGPQGYGIYATYQPAASATSQAGLLSAIQQVVTPAGLQQTPLQLQSLERGTYLVSHPSLFWAVNQAATAHGVVQQLSSRTPGWGTTVYNGSQGYGIYLTYRPIA
jgi:hypothetical protein